MLALIFLAENSFAQNYVDIARIYFNTTPLNEFGNSGSKTRINELGVDLTIPIVLKKTVLLTGLMAESTSVKLDQDLAIARISSYTLRFGFNKKFSDAWSGTFLAIPKLASDFRESTDKNFQIGALGLLRYNRNETFNYKVGVYYNAELFGTFFVPILGLYHGGPDKKFEANVLLPSLVDLNYKIAQWANVGLNFTGQIKSYHLSGQTTGGLPGYVVKTSNEICSYLRINFSSRISLYTRVGVSVLRSYKVYDQDDKIDLGISLLKIGDNRSQLNSNFSNGLLFQSILLYRFVQN